MGKASTTTHLPRVRNASFQQSDALGAEVDVPCHWQTSICHNELYAVILLSHLSVECTNPISSDCRLILYTLRMSLDMWTKTIESTKSILNWRSSYVDKRLWVDGLIWAVPWSNVWWLTVNAVVNRSTHTDYTVTFSLSLKNTSNHGKRACVYKKGLWTQGEFQRVKAIVKLQNSRKSDLGSIRGNMPKWISPWKCERNWMYWFFSMLRFC
jgi:hypothetical protein